MYLRGSDKAELTLIGVTELNNDLYAMGYFLINPKREYEPVPGSPPFLRLTRPKPYRRGARFRAENGVAYKNAEPLELNRVHLYAVTLEQEIKFERVP
jgi:hypothetical protein